MNIGELAEQTGLTRSRIRFYEARGLLSAVNRSGNGYRTYTPQAVLVLKLITSAQLAGFSLDEIAKVLPANLSGDWKHAETVALFKEKLVGINDMLTRLAFIKSNLESLIQQMENRPEGSDCDENARGLMSTIIQQADRMTAASET